MKFPVKVGAGFLVSGKVFLLSLPGQTEPQKIIIHRRVRGVHREVFYFLLLTLLLCDICALCGEKNILPGNGEISLVNNQ